MRINFKQILSIAIVLPILWQQGVFAAESFANLRPMPAVEKKDVKNREAVRVNVGEILFSVIAEINTEYPGFILRIRGLDKIDPDLFIWFKPHPEAFKDDEDPESEAEENVFAIIRELLKNAMDEPPDSEVRIEVVRSVPRSTPQVSIIVKNKNPVNFQLLREKAMEGVEKGFIWLDKTTRTLIYDDRFDLSDLNYRQIHSKDKFSTLLEESAKRNQMPNPDYELLFVEFLGRGKTRADAHTPWSLGLGMNLIRDYVVAGGGTLRVESSDTAGTTVIITFEQSYVPPTRETEPQKPIYTHILRPRAYAEIIRDAARLSERKGMLIKYGIYTQAELADKERLYRRFRMERDLSSFNVYEKVFIWQYMILTKLNLTNEDLFNKLMDWVRKQQEAESTRLEIGGLYIGFVWESRIPATDKVVSILANDIIPPYAEMNVIDVGCGNGDVAIALALYRNNAHFTAIDANPVNIATAIDKLLERKKENKRIPTNLKFHLRDCRSPLPGQDIPNRGIPYGKNTFDVALLLEGVMDENSFTWGAQKELWGGVLDVVKKDAGTIVFFGLEGSESLHEIVADEAYEIVPRNHKGFFSHMEKRWKQTFTLPWLTDESLTGKTNLCVWDLSQRRKPVPLTSSSLQPRRVTQSPQRMLFDKFGNTMRPVYSSIIRPRSYIDREKYDTSSFVAQVPLYVTQVRKAWVGNLTGQNIPEEIILSTALRLWFKNYGIGLNPAILSSILVRTGNNTIALILSSGETIDLLKKTAGDYEWVLTDQAKAVLVIRTILSNTYPAAQPDTISKRTFCDPALFQNSILRPQAVIDRKKEGGGNAGTLTIAPAEFYQNFQFEKVLHSNPKRGWNIFLCRYSGKTKGNLVNGALYALKAAHAGSVIFSDRAPALPRSKAFFEPQLAFYNDANPAHLPRLCGVVNLDGFYSGKTHYEGNALLFEYVDGLRFDEYLKRKAGELSGEEWARLAVDLSIELLEAYRDTYETHGYMNGDLDPDGIMIADKGPDEKRKLFFVDNDSTTKIGGKGNVHLARTLLGKPVYKSDAWIARFGLASLTGSSDIAHPADDVYALCTLLLHSIGSAQCPGFRISLLARDAKGINKIIQAQPEKIRRLMEFLNLYRLKSGNEYLLPHLLDGIRNLALRAPEIKSGGLTRRAEVQNSILRPSAYDMVDSLTLQVIPPHAYSFRQENVLPESVSGGLKGLASKAAGASVLRPQSVLERAGAKKYDSPTAVFSGLMEKFRKAGYTEDQAQLVIAQIWFDAFEDGWSEAYKRLGLIADMAIEARLQPDDYRQLNQLWDLTYDPGYEGSILMRIKKIKADLDASRKKLAMEGHPPERIKEVIALLKGLIGVFPSGIADELWRGTDFLIKYARESYKKADDDAREYRAAQDMAAAADARIKKPEIKIEQFDDPQELYNVYITISYPKGPGSKEKLFEQLVEVRTNNDCMYIAGFRMNTWSNLSHEAKLETFNWRQEVLAEAKKYAGDHDLKRLIYIPYFEYRHRGGSCSTYGGYINFTALPFDFGFRLRAGDEAAVFSVSHKDDASSHIFWEYTLSEEESSRAVGVTEVGTITEPKAGDIIYINSDSSVRRVKEVEYDIATCDCIDIKGEVTGGSKISLRRLAILCHEKKAFILREGVKGPIPMPVRKKGNIIKTFLVDGNAVRKFGEAGINITAIIKEAIGIAVNTTGTSNFLKLRDPQPVNLDISRFNDLIRNHPADLREFLTFSMAWKLVKVIENAAGVTNGRGLPRVKPVVAQQLNNLHSSILRPRAMRERDESPIDPLIARYDEITRFIGYLFNRIEQAHMDAQPRLLLKAKICRVSNRTPFVVSAILAGVRSNMCDLSTCAYYLNAQVQATGVTFSDEESGFIKNAAERFLTGEMTDFDQAQYQNQRSSQESLQEIAMMFDIARVFHPGPIDQKHTGKSYPERFVLFGKEITGVAELHRDPYSLELCAGLFNQIITGHPLFMEEVREGRWLFLLEGRQRRQEDELDGEPKGVMSGIARITGIPVINPIYNWASWEIIRRVIAHGEQSASFSEADVIAFCVGSVASQFTGGDIHEASRRLLRSWSNGMSVHDLIECFYKSRAQKPKVYNPKARAIDDYSRNLQAEMTQDKLRDVLLAHPNVKYVFCLRGTCICARSSSAPEYRPDPYLSYGGILIPVFNPHPSPLPFREREEWGGL